MTDLTNKQPKIIACDLDGTLLNSKALLSDENKNAIINMVEKGTFFVPTTGRALYEINFDILSLEKIRYFITSNGARIFDKETGRSVETLIDSKDLEKILEITGDYKVYLTIHHNGMSFADESLSSSEQMEDFNISSYYQHHIKTTSVKMPFFKEYFSQKLEVEMVCGFFKHESELLECKERLSKIGSIFVTNSANNSIEILSAKATKGNALKAFANELGVDISDVVAVGDSPNDLTMINAAGLGLATANASERVKACADRVICSNEENVAAYLLEKFFE